MTKAASLPQHPRRRIIESSDDESVKVVIGKKTDPNIRHQVRQDHELAEKMQNDLNNERDDLMWDEMDQDHDWQVAEKTKDEWNTDFESKLSMTRFGNMMKNIINKGKNQKENNRRTKEGELTNYQKEMTKTLSNTRPDQMTKEQATS